jgi:hypothetical protein
MIQKKEAELNGPGPTIFDVKSELENTISHPSLSLSGTSSISDQSLIIKTKSPRKESCSHLPVA